MKKWLSGHLTASGYIVTYEENGKERKMEFPTEEEAQEYLENDY